MAFIQCHDDLIWFAFQTFEYEWRAHLGQKVTASNTPPQINSIQSSNIALIPFFWKVTFIYHTQHQKFTNHHTSITKLSPLSVRKDQPYSNSLIFPWVPEILTYILTRGIQLRWPFEWKCYSDHSTITISRKSSQTPYFSPMVCGISALHIGTSETFLSNLLEKVSKTFLLQYNNHLIAPQ